jgi:cell pole-organizing protein PopZ
MRKILYPLVLMGVVFAGAAVAQSTPGFTQLQNDAAAQELELAAQQRYQAQQTIQTLQQASPYASPPISGLPPAPLDAQLAADAERIRILQDQQLAAGNARILAIRPAIDGPPPKK